MPKVDLKPRVKIDPKHRIVIPKIIWDHVKLKSGTLVELELYGADKILLTVLKG